MVGSVVDGPVLYDRPRVRAVHGAWSQGGGAPWTSSWGNAAGHVNGPHPTVRVVSLPGARRGIVAPMMIGVDDASDPRLADYVDLTDPELRKRTEAERGF